MKRRLKNRSCWVLAVLIFIVAGFPVAADTPAAGKTITTVGKVEVDGQKAFTGMTVQPSATIKTYENAFIEVVFNKKNIFKIFENSEAVLDLDAQEKSIFLKTGAIANLIKKLDALQDRFRPRYKIATSTAVAGVRGTAFFVKVEDSTTTYICVCNGEIELTNMTDANKTLIAEKHHQAVRFTREKEKTILSPAKMLYHSDSGMEKLASEIDEKIDWDKIGTTQK